MDRRQILIIGFDGLGDRPSAELGDRTPLEAASKAFLDSLASKGAQGLVDPIAPGVIPGSDTSHLALFGLDPFEVYPGRGPFEAIGAGAVLEPGDVAFRGNFATVDENLVVLDRRAGRSDFGLDELVRVLNKEIREVEGLEVRFYRAAEHRVAVVVRGEGISPRVSDTDPGIEGLKILDSRPEEPGEGARRLADVVNKLTRLAHRILAGHEINRLRAEKGLPPANAILLRGAGSLPKLRRVQDLDRIEIARAGAVSATALIKGVAKLLGFDVVHPEGATGGVNTDVFSKARAARAVIDKGYDLVYLHFKGTDAASHDRKPSLKARFIERCDAALLEILGDLVEGDLVVAVTGDHTTSSTLGIHTSDPVPLLIYSRDVFSDRLGRFSERSARQGYLGRIRGRDLIYLISDLAGRQDKFGA